MANFDVELNDEVENFTVEFGEIQRITVDDFDKLRNRPSYAGQAMTHETNIPEVPTAVSQLTNDADYQTGSEVESAISIAVGDEKDAREQADAGLSRDIGVVDGKVDAEVDARERADTALQGAIDDEETARKNADNGLQGQIDAITSSSDVVDIVGTYAELLQYSTAGLGDKDVIKVLQDETHNDAMSYYRWNKSSSTWSYIGSEGPYYTKSETNTLLGDKQNTLTAGSNITISSNNTISATDTTYTAGNGLTLTGTEFSADTTVLQPKLTAGDGITITGNTISANIDPADFFTASETVDGTGSEMTLNNTIQAKIKSVQMDGDTFQQTYSGKNLCGIPDQTFTHANVSVTIQNGEITLNGTANTSATYNLLPIYSTTLDGTYTTSLIYVSGSISNTSQSNLNVRYSDSTSIVTGSQATIRNENSYRTWSVENSNVIFGIYLSSGTIYDNVKFKFQITEGSEEDYNFEPYTHGPAPNPDYPQPIQVVTGEQTVTISDGVTSQTFTVDLGSIELCKIGDYRDKIFNNDPNEGWYNPELEDNAWYVHKATSKVVLDGTETWTENGSPLRYCSATISDALVITNTGQLTPIMSNYYTSATPSDIYARSVDYGISLNTSAGIRLRNKDCTSRSQLLSWLSNNNTAVYYALATPTDTKITDATLISELNALADALGYKDKTIITVSATGTNLPAILEVSAYQNSLAGVLGVIGRAEAA